MISRRRRASGAKAAVSIVVAGSLLLTGCAASNFTRVPVQSRPPEHVFQKSYELGQQKTAFVGEQILSVKDYFVIRTAGAAMRPTKPFQMDATQGIHASWSTGKDYTIYGKFTHQGIEYTVVEVPDVKVPMQNNTYCGLVLPIFPDGRPLNALFATCSGGPPIPVDLGAGPLAVSFSPAGATFSPVVAESVDASSGYLNFELLYGGTDGRSFTLTYREYTRDDLIKAAFSQNVLYPNASETIRFRSVRLRIHEVTGERLVYTVEADNLTNTLVGQ